MISWIWQGLNYQFTSKSHISHHLCSLCLLISPGHHQFCCFPMTPQSPLCLCISGEITIKSQFFLVKSPWDPHVRLGQSQASARSSTVSWHPPQPSTPRARPPPWPRPLAGRRRHNLRRRSRTWDFSWKMQKKHLDKFGDLTGKMVTQWFKHI